MKMCICDACYYEGGNKKPLNERKITLSKYKISYKRELKKIALDVCEDHSNFFKVCESFQEAENKVSALFGF